MDLINKAVNAIERVNLKDYKVYDLENKNPFYNYIIVASGSTRQSNALLDHLKDELKDAYEIRGVEGKRTGWLLVDLGELILHIFDTETKDFYKFEERFINIKELNIK